MGGAGGGGGGMKKNGMSCAAVVTGTLTLVMLNKLRCHTHLYFSANQMPRPLVFFSQSDYLIQIVDINSHT